MRTDTTYMDMIPITLSLYEFRGNNIKFKYLSSPFRDKTFYHI